MKQGHLGSDKNSTNSISFLFPKSFYFTTVEKPKRRTCKYIYCNKWLPIGRKSEFCSNVCNSSYWKRKKRLSTGVPIKKRALSRKHLLGF